MLPGRELTIYEQSLSALRVSYGYTDQKAQANQKVNAAL
jgi:hypothetical protein